MKHNLTLILLVFIIQISQAQTGPYAKIKFKANPSEIVKILSEGLDMENISREGEYFIAELSTEEQAIVRKHTSSIAIITNDVSSFYSTRANQKSELNLRSNAITPPGFQFGTLGSYLKYSEMVQMLDSMHRRYPNLISSKKSIGNTLEGNPMYVVKISDHPDIEEPQEKQVLFDAMHHAREPQGMMQLMYFMWYIMDRYEQGDQIARYIIDNRELFFVPIVNPDGYLFNQSTNPNGGGMWRKNRRENADATMGVDLNRNYGYDWGYDDIGSSPFGNSNTFRGTSGFSEPETQNMRDFVNTKKFKSNLSYHTYGGYLIYPFGARENYYTKDSNLFRQYADSLTKDNGYSYGTVFETLSYFANGGSCDWMYGDSSHSKIISFTPEVGFSNDGFWPQPSRIVPLAEENIAPNLFLAMYGVNGLDVINADTIFTTDTSYSLNLNYFSAGLKENSKIKSYLDFYGNPIIQTNFDTLNITSLTTFTKKPYNFALNFNIGLQKYSIPYRIVTLIDGIAQFDSALLIIDRTTGINTAKKETEIKIFPNPSSKTITVDYNFKPNTQVAIYNTTGKLLIESKTKTTDVSKLTAGVYFISIKEGNKVVGIESFRKE